MKKELLGNTTAQPLLDPTITPLSAGTSTTSWIEKTAFLSMIAALAVGAASGTPTAQSVKITIQEADDASGTNAANLVDINGDAIEIELTEDSVSSIADVDLTGARAYVGASVAVAFTGGTTPAIPVNIFAVLGDPRDTREI